MKFNSRRSSASCAVIRTGLRATHVVFGGSLVSTGTTLVTPVIRCINLAWHDITDGFLAWNAWPATPLSSPHRRLASPLCLPDSPPGQLGTRRSPRGSQPAFFFRAYDRDARKWKGTSTLWSASLALDPVITSDQMYSKDAKSAAVGSRQHSGGPCRHVEVATKTKRDFFVFFLLLFLFLVWFFFFLHAHKVATRYQVGQHLQPRTKKESKNTAVLLRSVSPLSVSHPPHLDGKVSRCQTFFNWLSYSHTDPGQFYGKNWIRLVFVPFLSLWRFLFFFLSVLYRSDVLQFCAQSRRSATGDVMWSSARVYQSTFEIKL